MNRKEDIFDRIMGYKRLRALYPFYSRHKEQILYLFLGGLAFLLGIISFWFLVYICRITPLAANIITWIICVVFAYLTNRTWVFSSKKTGISRITKEFFAFAFGRLSTLGIEEIVLWIGIDLLNVNAMLIKIIAQIIVIIMNYIISKYIIFKK